MTVHTVTTTYCDVCNAGCHGPSVTGGRGVYRGLRREAVDAGWLFRGGIDICPECQDDEERKEHKEKSHEAHR